ncbi:MAG: hypothetical protein QG565_889 [Campylobacterota bacterium]|nr:hypothetical protein [Campylobacterota bacterium]
MLKGNNNIIENSKMTSQSNILIYQTEDGQTKIQTRLEDETVWLTQEQMAELFQKSRSTINEHIKNIYEEKELEEIVTMKKFGISEFAKKPTNFYNLDVIISVGYRVKSLQGTKFRQWATARLKEYMIKGFVMDDERLKEARNDYFDELLARIRDIRSSEKVFWRKVLEIYATSVDYDPREKSSQEFFKTIQNKMHFATHGKTAAEIVYERADGSKIHMGMTSFNGAKPIKSEAIIAKNYLSEKELDILNRIVTMYLEFAELQAHSRKPMYMKDWIKKLDDFLQVSDFEILNNKGTISHRQALEKADEEYLSYKEKTKNELSRVEEDFIEHLDAAVKALKIKN